MAEVQFLSLDIVLQIHEKQIQEKGGAPEILSKDKLKGAIGQPKQTFEGRYLHDDLFVMAASYLTSIVTSHPFMDGNKRTATHSAIAFLYRNGYQIAEFHETELAELTLDYLAKDKTKEDIANFLASHAKSVNT